VERQHHRRDQHLDRRAPARHRPAAAADVRQASTTCVITHTELK
jgi:hypothetical protein